MAKTSKWKEGREVVLVLACHPSNTTLTHSLSFTLMAKIITRRRTTITTNLKTRLQKFALTLDLAKLKTPGGVFIGTRGKGATWKARGPKRRRARPKGRGNAAQAAFPWPCQGSARLASVSASSSLSPVRWIFWFLDLMSWTDKISSLK